jgi:hypothetical protein
MLFVFSRFNMSCENAETCYYSSWKRILIFFVIFKLMRHLMVRVESKLLSVPVLHS